MTEPLFIATSAVARLIGFDSPATFLRERARLERDEGFPLPMPTKRRPMIWRRSAVEAWLAEADSPAPPPPSGANVYLLKEARR